MSGQEHRVKKYFNCQGIKPQTIEFHALMLYHWAIETLVSLAFYATHLLCSDKFSNVESVMCVNGLRKMVNSELNDEIEKDVYFHLFISIGQRKEQYTVYCCYYSLASVLHVFIFFLVGARWYWGSNDTEVGMMCDWKLSTNLLFFFTAQMQDFQ